MSEVHTVSCVEAIYCLNEQWMVSYCFLALCMLETYSFMLQVLLKLINDLIVNTFIKLN